MSKVRSITPNGPADFTPELGNYKTLQPFRYWCQKVLPLVYDDSLSYYELLCKVVDYLNKTMEDVETLHVDITNLHAAYEQLQNYVNTYFSSLDVQQEINNKLDKMATDGTLYEIISKYTDPIVSEQNSKIDVLKSRMDTFASLPDGSTSGDAELIDIRVKADGTTATTAGNAVREQVNELKEDLVDLTNNVIREYSLDKVGYVKLNGQFDTDALARRTDYISVDEGQTVEYETRIYDVGYSIAFFDVSKTIMQSESIVGIQTRDVASVTVPSGAKYMIASTYDWQWSYVKVLTKCLIKKDIDLINEDINSIAKENSISVYTDLTLGYYINSSGETTPSKDLYVTDYIEVKDFDKVYVNLADTDIRTSALYDKDKHFVKFIKISTPNVDIPATITINNPKYYYLRFTIKPIDRENLKLVGHLKHDFLSSEIDNLSFSIFQKFGVVGDSLSVGYIASGSYEQNVRNINYSWGQVLARRIGTKCLNFGRSGATTETWQTYPECYNALVQQDNKCQAYIIGLGTNDVINGDLGTLDDVNTINYSNNPNTFYGRFGKIISQIREFSSLAKIFVFTIPYPRDDEDKNTAIRNICAKFSSVNNVFLVDLAKDYENYFKNDSITNEYFGDHFSAIGYAKLSRINEIALSETMNYYSYNFRDANLIPYGNNDVVN